MSSAIRSFPLNTPYDYFLGIAEKYAKAMVRRNRRATNPYHLADIWTRNGAFFLRHKQSYLLGVKYAGVFIPTHFAPHNLRQGYDLLLKAKKEKVIFSVTPDLSQDLVKLGFAKVPDWIINLCKKYLGYPEHKDLVFSWHVNIVDVIRLLRDKNFFQNRTQPERTQVSNFRRKKQKVSVPVVPKWKKEYIKSRPTLAAIWPVPA